VWGVDVKQNTGRHLVHRFQMLREPGTAAFLESGTKLRPQ